MPPAAREAMAPRALVAGTVTIVAWSSAFVATSFAVRQMNAPTLILARFTLATIAFALLVPLGKVRWPARRDWPALFLLGGIGQAGYQLPLAIAQTRISAGLASVLFALVPGMAAILAYPLLGERLPVLGFIGMLVAFLGAAMVASRNGGLSGIDPFAAVAFLGCLCSALYFVLQKRWHAVYSGLELTAYSAWASLIAVAFAAPFLSIDVPRIGLNGWFAIVYLALASNLIGYAAWSYALQNAPAGRIASFLYLLPPLTFLMGFVALGERISLRAGIGCAITLAGVLIALRAKRADPDA